MAGWAERAPGAGAAVVIGAGGLVAGYLGTAAGAAALAAGIALLARAGRPGRSRPGRSRPGAWIALAALVGARVVAGAGDERRDAIAWAGLAERGAAVPIHATARIETVRPLRAGAWSVRGELSDCAGPCAGAAVRWTWRGEEAPREGSRVALAARLHAEPPRAPPGSRFPPPGLGPGARRAALSDVRILATGDPAVPALAGAERHLRERIHARWGPALAPLVDALLLGERRELDGALVDAFARSGTVHILAVSGLHVAFLAELLSLALGLARLGPAARAGWATVLLAAYAALVGAPPSAVRAATMASLALWARGSERRVDPWQPWGAAAVFLLAWRPGELFALGFLLSFAAVGGLLALAGPLEARLARRGPAGERPARATAFVAAGLAATTAATVATLPLQAAAFGWIAPVGFVANPVAVPLAGVGLPLAWLALAADAIGASVLAGPLARAAGSALALLGAVAAGTGAGARPWVPGPAGWAVAAIAGLAAGFLVARRRPAAGAALLVPALALALAARPPEAPGLEIVWLDVGQGDAIALHFPDGATWLVDAGPADPFGDAGRRVVLPYLRRRGVKRIERLVTTHPDLDHVGGAATVVEGIPVRAWASAGPVDEAPAWLALLAARGPRAETLRAGMRLRQGGARIDVLHPGEAWVPADPYRSRVTPNEGSVVLLVSRGPCRALLTGDIGSPAEGALAAELGDSLRAELLHAGHHGSRHSSTARFLARVRPREVVVSAGRGNRHGHPHPDALARLAEAGARVWRTDRLGAVRARCGARGWHLSGARVYLR